MSTGRRRESHFNSEEVLRSYPIEIVEFNTGGASRSQLAGHSFEFDNSAALQRLFLSFVPRSCGGRRSPRWRSVRHLPFDWARVSRKGPRLARQDIENTHFYLIARWSSHTAERDVRGRYKVRRTSASLVARHCPKEQRGRHWSTRRTRPGGCCSTAGY